MMAFRTRRFLKEEVLRLEYRVKDLEERLCPTEQHDWLTVGYRHVHVGCGETQSITRYKCRKCGKEKEDW
jgi:hypothetical protein